MSAAIAAALRAQAATLLALADSLESPQPTKLAPSVYYDETTSPTQPTSRRAWREWCARHDVATTRAGTRLLARREDVDDALLAHAKCAAPVVQANEGGVILGRGLRMIGGAR